MIERAAASTPASPLVKSRTSAAGFRHSGYLEGVGGLRLHYRTWEVAEPRAGLIIVHGLGEHGGRYGEFAEAMARFGFSSFAMDARGHGLSEGRRGHTRRFAMYLQDLDRFRREVRGLVEPGCPLFIVGHSMGGLVTLRYLQEFDPPLRGAVVTSPWLATAVEIPRWKSMLSGVLNRVLPALPFSLGLNADHLSRDPEVGRRYREDPLVHDRVTPRVFSEVSQAMGLVFQRIDRLKVPMLLLLAGDDRIVATQRTQALAGALPPEKVDVRVLPAYYHEVLNAPERIRVFAEIRDWIAARLD